MPKERPITPVISRPWTLIPLTLSLGLLACGDKYDDDDGDDDTAVDADGDGYPAADDCDDANAEVNPDAAEICDGIDNDCDALVDDEDDSLDGSTGGTFYADADGDGYGGADSAVQACAAPSGLIEDGSDCDDSDAAVNPGATEVCDDADVDEDCSGAADDADDGVDPTTLTPGWPDLDGDGYGDAAGTAGTWCDLPSDHVADDTDCDDTDAAVNPGATEVCDDADVDEDCSGAADDADAGVDTSTQTETWPDLDGDGYGDLDATSVWYCDPPSDTVADGTDCDDDDDTVNPGATEVCNGVDDDCDGAIDTSDCTLCSDLSVITYYDSFNTGEEPADVAAIALGATSTATSSGSDFATEYDAATWDILVVDVPGSSIPTQVSDRIATQIAAGGIVLFSWWDLDGDSTLAATLGVTVDSSFSTPMPLYPTSGTTLWTIEENLPNPIANNTSDAGDNGDVVSPIDTATSQQLAYFDGDTTQAAITATNNGQVLVNGFLPWDFQDTDDDASGVSDMVELFINEFVWTTECVP